MGYIRKRPRAGGGVYLTYVFNDPSGKRIERSVGFDMQEAAERINEIEQRLRDGTWGQPELTLDLFFNQYLMIKKQQGLKPSTILDYQNVADNHLLPFFHGRPLKQISPMIIISFLDQMEKNGVSGATAGKVLRYLRTIMRTASVLEIIDRDPTANIRAPRVERKPVLFLERDEILRVLSLSPEPIRALIATGCLAGLRIGEILALVGESIDHERGRIKVRRTWSKKFGFGPPKTAAGVRDVPMIRQLREELEHLYEYQGMPASNELVFYNFEGDRYNRVRKELRAALDASGVKQITPHQMRHSYATLQQASGNGIDPKSLQILMGHSSIRVTMDTYVHASSLAIDQASKGLERFMDGGLRVVELTKEKGREKTESEGETLAG